MTEPGKDEARERTPERRRERIVEPKAIWIAAIVMAAWGAVYLSLGRNEGGGICLACAAVLAAVAWRLRAP
jgi:hypothetical protein